MHEGLPCFSFLPLERLAEKLQAHGEPFVPAAQVLFHSAKLRP
jgi:hypothetical protein